MKAGVGVALGLALLGAASPPLSAGGFEGDLLPRLSGSTIVLDGLSDHDGSTASNLGVFQYTLGELSGGFTEDPGFQPQEGNGLPGGSFLGFNVVGPLRYWDGTGTANLATAPADRSFVLYLGPASVRITGATAAATRFVVVQLTDTGAGHRHLNAQVLGLPSAMGSYTDGQGGMFDPPPDGIYAFPIQVTDAASNTTLSPNFVSGITWLVYNQNLSDAQLSAAADTLVAPEPATAAVAGIAGMILLVRRRRP